MMTAQCWSIVIARHLTTAVLTLFMPSFAGAQVVRGRAVALGGQPAGGVVVLLEDSLGVTVRRSMTATDGRFVLSAPGAGNYSLRTMRLGYRSAHVRLPSLATGHDTIMEIALEPVPLRLARVVVRARRNCGGTADNTQAAELWGVVRTALEAQALTAASANYRMKTRITDAEMDVLGNALGPRSTRYREGPAVQPFVSASPESLASQGYVTSNRGPVDWRSLAERGSDGELMFRGPDAAVLLSDHFARGHCLELVASPDTGQSLLGLAFRPIRPSRGLVDIKGVMWVDRQTSELRQITFSYDPIPRAIDGGIGGSIGYVALPTGGWVLSEWAIRMPLLQRTAVGVPDGGTGRMRNEWRLLRTGTHVTRGEVLDVRRDGVPLWTALTGRVVMRIASAERGGASPAQIRLGILPSAGDTTKITSRPGGGIRLLTPDSLGRYEAGSLSSGDEVRVLVWNLSVDSLAIAPDTIVVAARGAGDTSVIDLRAPAAADVSTRLCGAGGRDTTTRAVIGVVRDESGAGVSNAEVQAGFVGSPRQVASGRFMARSESRIARTDSSGRFVICAVPTALPITLRAQDSQRESEPLIIRLRADRAYAIAGLVLPRVGEAGRP